MNGFEMLGIVEFFFFWLKIYLVLAFFFVLKAENVQ